MRLGLPTAPPGVCVLRSGDFEAWVLPWGARLMQVWWLAAPEGPRPLTLGFQDPLAYRQDQMALGSTCGRYANRLQDARLHYGGQVFALDVNHPLGHCIHGGSIGFDRQPWQVCASAPDAVTLALDSPDGEMGFPGRCRVTLGMGWVDTALHWQVHAQLDAACPMNVVQHSYWNLDGHKDIGGHHLQVAADEHHPIDERELPLPASPVAGSALDFREARRLDVTQVQALEGALVLRPGTPGERPEVATLAVADLAMHLATDQSWLHLYAGAGLVPTQAPFGVTHGPAAGLCLESEAMPNGPALGAPVWVGPGRDYHHHVSWRFQPL